MLPEIEQNENFSLAYRYVTETAENIFLTGKAGTGKTTFLKYLVADSMKRVVVAAPTGVAAINAGGVTLHSLFQLPFSPFLPTRAGKDELLKKIRFSKDRTQILKSLELLVIDEVSMVRADTLDAIDTILRSVRRNYDLPFGGVQLLFIGDLFQLPPVVRSEEWIHLNEFYASPFFFDSLVIREQMPLLIELTKIYRQKESSFVELLNRVRTNHLTADDFVALDARFNPGFRPHTDEKYITLTSHNKQAELINTAALQRLPAEAFICNAVIEGEFGEHLYPADAELKLKKGAQVMFLKNDTQKQYFNGKIGIVHDFNDGRITVDCDGEKIYVAPHQWENTRYTAGRDGVLMQESLGTFTQFPLRTAWAITIHKSQGLTFERLMLDAAAAFAAGQVYVALSRCTSLEGIVLLSRIPASAVQSNSEVVKAQTQLARDGAPEKHFNNARLMFTMQILEDLYLLRELSTEALGLSSTVLLNRSKLNTEAVSHSAGLSEKINALARQGEKFLAQAGGLLKENSVLEENGALQERLAAAGKYFSSQLQELGRLHQQAAYSTEHKDVAESVTPIINNIETLLRKNISFFSIPGDSFSLTGFLRHKAGFKTERGKRNIYGSGDSATSTAHGPAGLYLLLKDWRDAMCRETGLPIFRVASQKTLTEIAAALPRDKKELLLVSGFGPVKVRDWGNEILDLVNEWCEENNIERDEPSAALPTKKDRQKNRNEKSTSSDDSFQLYKRGYTVEEIAAERKLARTTVEGHLSVYAGSGEMDVRAYLGDEKYEMIAGPARKDPQPTLSEIKSALPPEIGFGEIRMVLLAEQFSRSTTTA